MKQFRWFLSLAVVLALTTCCFAENDNYNDTLWRFNDYMGVLSDEDAEALDDWIYTQIEACACDFPIFIDEDFQGYSAEEYGEWFFTENDFGYGPDRDGILLLVGVDAGEVAVLPFGDRATYLFDPMTCGGLAEEFAEDVDDDGYHEALNEYLSEVFRLTGDTSGAAGSTDTVTDPGRTADFIPPVEEMPDWYPEDVSGFVDFLDPDAPRVVDDADLFTDEQEAAFAETLAELREKFGSDFVLFTDMSTHGLSRAVYAADFYTFNGYGVGDDFNGMVLFICMEPGNRGWWTAATGDCRRLITEQNINQIDDRLEPYMLRGNYAEGVANYYEDMSRLFATGHVPRAAWKNALLAIISMVLGAIVGGGVLLFLRSGMKTVTQAAEADEYLVKDSFVLRNRRDYYLRSHTTRRRIERSGKGGGSSFSGGYSSSSGRSFSGGGRSF